MVGMESAMARIGTDTNRQAGRPDGPDSRRNSDPAVGRFGLGRLHIAAGYARIGLIVRRIAAACLAALKNGPKVDLGPAVAGTAAGVVVAGIALRAAEKNTSAPVAASAVHMQAREPLPLLGPLDQSGQQVRKAAGRPSGPSAAEAWDLQHWRLHFE